MCPKQRAGLRQHLLLYTPANLLAIVTLLQFEQVDCLFSLPDIRASPANRMTRAVLSILVMFVCLAPMLEVNSKQGDFKKAIEAFELSINSMMERYKLLMDREVDLLTNLRDSTDNTLDILQNSEQYAAAKKIFETAKESYPKLKAKFLLFNEDKELLLEYCQEDDGGWNLLACVRKCEGDDIQASPANRMTRTVLSILVMFVCLAPMLEVNSTQRAGLNKSYSSNPNPHCQPSGHQDFIAVGSRSIVNSLSQTSKHLQPTG
ncbi:unnamed protein product [Arctogadus glacialis]